jgi:hypothetical protein
VTVPTLMMVTQMKIMMKIMVRMRQFPPTTTIVLTGVLTTHIFTPAIMTFTSLILTNAAAKELLQRIIYRA